MIGVAFDFDAFRTKVIRETQLTERKRCISNKPADLLHMAISRMLCLCYVYLDISVCFSPLVAVSATTVQFRYFGQY